VGALKSNDCSSGRAATDVLYPVCIASAEVLLAFRVWASWNRSRKVLVILCGAAVVLPAGMAVACVYLGSELPNASAQSMYLGGKLNCALDLPLRVAVEYGFLMGYELILFCLTAYRWHSQCHITNTRLIRLAYRDALIYLMCMILCSAVNIAQIMTATIYRTAYFNSSQIVIHSILSTRIWFRLHACAAQGYQSVPSISLTTFHASRMS